MDFGSQGSIVTRLCRCGCGEATPLATKTSRRDGTVKGQPVEWLRGHARWSTGPMYVAGAPDECWLWRGCKEPFGYGIRRVDGKQKRAHRLVYEELVGPIPEGLVLDHLCNVTSCVNPAHLEPVTNSENLRRMHRRRREAATWIKPPAVPQ